MENGFYNKEQEETFQPLRRQRGAHGSLRNIHTYADRLIQKRLLRIQADYKMYTPIH
jgi:hypothetical protein